MLHQRRARLRVRSAKRTLERVPGPIVLVAHAYAGAVIAAARNERLQALVYIAALAPDEGETVADVFYRAPPHVRAPKLSPDTHGLIYLPERAFAEAFAPNAIAEQQALLAALQRPIAPACITIPVGTPRWRDLPSWFLVAEQDYLIRSYPRPSASWRSACRLQEQRCPVSQVPIVLSRISTAAIGSLGEERSFLSAGGRRSV
jgi:hypothetical protein